MVTRAEDGVELWWEREGSGPAVLLVPGSGDSADAFRQSSVTPSTSPG